MTVESTPAWLETVRRILIGVLVASLGIGFLVAIAAIMNDRFFSNRLSSYLLPLPLIGILYGCLALTAVYVARRGRFVRAMVIALVLYTAGAVAWVVAMWADFKGMVVLTEHVATIAASLTIPAIALSLAGHLLALPGSMLLLRILILIEVISLGNFSFSCAIASVDADAGNPTRI